MANSSKNKKYHYLYKTINLINGKYYYGMHSTNNLKDEYVGSGKYLWYAIKKYGIENFKLDILEFFDTREALIEAEKKLVTEIQVNDLNCMNLKPGGSGGLMNDVHREKWINARYTTHKESFKQRAIELRKRQIDQFENDPEYRQLRIEQLRRSALSRIKDGTFGFKNKKHTPETIEKMKRYKGKGSKEKNSQFGTKWITNEIENKKIKSTDQIPNGWRLGRKVKS
jgi:hypothetical protein